MLFDTALSCAAAPACQVRTEEECAEAVRQAQEMPDKAVLIECIVDRSDCSGEEQPWEARVGPRGSTALRVRVVVGGAPELVPVAWRTQAGAPVWGAGSAGNACPRRRAVELLQFGRTLQYASRK